MANMEMHGEGWSRIREEVRVREWIYRSLEEGKRTRWAVKDKYREIETDKKRVEKQAKINIEVIKYNGKDETKWYKTTNWVKGNWGYWTVEVPRNGSELSKKL